MSSITPANWEAINFDEVFTQISTTGKKVKTGETQVDGKYPVVDQGRTSISGYLNDESLVVADDNPLIIFGDHTRIIKWIDFPFIPGADGIKILKPARELSARFMYFFLRNLPIESKGYARHFKLLKEANYLLPPLAEQIRIAQKLDGLLAQVDTLKTRIDAIPTLIKRFRQSVLAAAVSGRLTEEWRTSSPSIEDWSAVTIGDIVSKVEAGKNLKCIETPPKDDEYGIIKISAVTWGQYNELQSKTLPTRELFLESRRIQKGDFLISRANTLQLLGNPVIVEKTTKNLMLSDKVLRLVMPEEKKKWMRIFLTSNFGRREIESRATGNQLSMRNIGQRDLLEIPLPNPSQTEIAEIVRRVEELFAFSDQLEAKVAAAKTRIDHLTQSILVKAFSGELVPQDQNDEPASEILVRIRAQRAAVPKTKHARKTSGLPTD